MHSTQGYSPIDPKRSVSLSGSDASPSVFEIESSSSKNAVLNNEDDSSKLSKKMIGSVIALLVMGSVAISTMGNQTLIDEEATSQAPTSFGKFDAKGRSILHDYDISKTFSSFLPAIAGEYGTPMWAFFVNRGQGITSYGTSNKDTSMMEFNSANKAYEYAASDGFRTFVKGSRSGSVVGGSSFTKEPFGKGKQNRDGCTRTMYVGMNEVEVEEMDVNNGLQTNALYFTIPNEKFGAMARRTTFTNLGSSTLKLNVLDGHPKLEPAGANDWNLKNMGRTLEAWMNVYRMEESKNTGPYYKLSLSLADTAQVSQIVEGHWAISFVESDSESSSEDDDKQQYAKLPFVVDPTVIFGATTSFDEPTVFFDGFKSAVELAMGPQITTSKTPCAFSASELVIPPNSNITVTTLFGRVPNEELYDSDVFDKVTQVGYVDDKYTQNMNQINHLTSKVAMRSGVPVFDSYVRQQYMDNFLRGGYPVVLGDEQNPKIFHTFSRIHGDLERDYNYFQIDACYFSMGPGNFRDVNQNRRCDSIQEPKVDTFDITLFLSLVQADGYNPLTVNSAIFVLPDADVPPEVAWSMDLDVVENAPASKTAKEIAAKVVKDESMRARVASILSNYQGFRPGDLFIAMDVRGITLDVSDEEFIKEVTTAAELKPSANFAQNGFWADHWTYHLDLVESYLTVFPDGEKELLFGDAGLSPFYMSPASCTTRATKYVLAPNLGPRQYNFVNLNDQEKIDAMAASGKIEPTDYNFQREAKNNEVFKVNAFTKFLMLAMTKFTILDPWGMGVEYEGGKPGWNDAMNGLCGLFGSGMPETYETLRIFQFLLQKAQKYPSHDIAIPTEMDTLMRVALSELDLREQAPTESQDADFAYWDNVRTGVETYRESTRITFTGEFVSWSTQNELIPALERFIAKMQAGAERAIALYGGITPTYWIFNVDSYDVLDGTDDSGFTYVRPTAFSPKTVPIFLEGPIRQMKTLETKEEKLKVYKSVQASELHDTALGMYSISGSLKGMSFEVGRMMAFAPGWLENQSIWLHMSYKFYLEMLRGKLYTEFFDELTTGLVAFMDPKTYGRSPLECSSFIVSSAHPDTSIHGQGYLARLSGSTAEFLSMWNLMMMGEEPFKVVSESLVISLRPIIPATWFDAKQEVEFTFLGHTPVIYHNPTGLDTWDESIVISSTSVTTKDGRNSLNPNGGEIIEPYASLVRNGDASLVEIYFSTVSQEEL